MKTWIAWAMVVGSVAGARLAHQGAMSAHGKVEAIDEPFALSERAARLTSLGYNELVADLFFIRLRGYYGGYYETNADSIGAIGESIAGLDPYFERVYTFAATAATLAPHGVGQDTYLRSIALLERGIPRFPQNWEMPLLAGQMYLQDLRTEDPAERRRWDEKGVGLVESAIRKPGAPVKATGDWAAVIRSRLGQRDRAISGLRELLLMSKDREVQKKLTARLAMIEASNADEIAAEIADMKKRFISRWHSERPAIGASMYLLLGQPLGTSFDLDELAADQVFVDPDNFQRLEPLLDDK